jgi:ribosomal protein L19
MRSLAANLEIVPCVTPCSMSSKVQVPAARAEFHFDIGDSVVVTVTLKIAEGGKERLQDFLGN